MTIENWTEVDRYLEGLFVAGDPALDAALADSDAAGLPSISVTPSQGKLLLLLAQMQGARSILEVGTLGGYSTIWLGRALPPGGRMITLESNPKHAEVAQRNLARAGLSAVVEVRLGRAVDTLAQIESERLGPFDFVFIDADKQSYPEYFAAALRLTRRGSVIVLDNVVRGGAVVDPANRELNVVGVRRVNALLAAEPRVSATAIQTVGGKGWDGFALARVTADP